MIGYADAMPEDLQIIVNGNSTWLADLFLAAGAHYGVVGATRTVDASFVYSDHSPFWDNGYPALLAIEDNPLTNPYYHRTTDTLDTLNIDFLTSATRAGLGLLAELAQPIKAGYPRTPVGLYADLFVYRSLFNSLHTVRLHWTAQTDAESYNIYRTSTPHLGYVKISTTPVTGTTFTDTICQLGTEYFYAITAVGPTGLESNRSRDANVSRPAAARSLLRRSFERRASASDLERHPMRGPHLAAALVIVVLILAAAAPAQELSLSFGAGGFFPSDDNYRQIYGSSLSLAGDIWLKLKGPIGFAAGFGRISDKGVAVPMSGGTQTYPLEFRRTSIPLLVFYQIEAGPVAIRLGAGAGIHSYRETWQTVDLDFRGHKTSPRIVLAVSAAVLKRVSLFCSGSFESIRTRESSFPDASINLGGFQMLGGLSFRVF